MREGQEVKSVQREPAAPWTKATGVGWSGLLCHALADVSLVLALSTKNDA